MHWIATSVWLLHAAEGTRRAEYGVKGSEMNVALTLQVDIIEFHWFGNANDYYTTIWHTLGETRHFFSEQG